jgi:hypothetical protein
VLLYYHYKERKILFKENHGRFRNSSREKKEKKLLISRSAAGTEMRHKGAGNEDFSLKKEKKNFQKAMQEEYFVRYRE